MNILKFDRRVALLTTTAAICAATAGTAHAQVAESAGPQFAEDSAQSDREERRLRDLLAQRPDALLSGEPETSFVFPRQPETVINDPRVIVPGPGEGYSPLPGEPGSLVDDPEAVNGVGQFFNAGNFGACTGSLINPRTVLFASHCINDAAADSYGSNTGGTPVSFTFTGNALPGILAWFNNGFATDEDLFVYNVEQILFNPDALVNPGARGFLEADIALAALDTPAANVPTWALLFSPLPVPDAITTVDGTGYNVRVTGYGRSGVGATGDTNSVDFRRRAAENVVGILGSINDRNEWLFGPGDYGLPQNLYQTDFDDPSRQNRFDFNLFRDDARDPEGNTASGDSGGPLILTDTFDIELVIGVLSGGSRFFMNQPDSSYGSSSLYQPIYAFWDWIAANSPYRYTQTVGGDGDWMDAEHWQTALDPNFYVIDENGNLVNGIPDEVGEGLDATSGKFGQVCNGAICLDLATRDIVDFDGNILLPGSPDTDPASGIDGNNRATVDALALLDQAAADLGLQTETDGVQGLLATVENGLPGASGFVPNNRDFNPGGPDEARVDARYYDVTLAAAGTTTLSDTVVIDKFTIAGAEAALDIESEGALTSLIDITQMAGSVNVDGTLTSRGDYLLFTGALTGNGTIETPFFTNMAGIVAPGTMGTIGTLDFNGNVILASASIYGVDLGSNGTSDLIRINATSFDADDNPLNGIASIGGTVVLNAVDGAVPRFGDSFTILQAEGGYSGTFQSPDISAILLPAFTYGDTSVELSVTARSYFSVIDSSSTTQLGFAQLLDQNRARYDDFDDILGPLDLQSVSTIQSTLESFAPTDVVAASSLGIAALDNTNRLVRNRMMTLGAGEAGSGDLAVMGQPTGVLGFAMAGSGEAPVSSTNARDAVSKRSDVLPDGVTGFLAGGYINGDSAAMPSAALSPENNFDGFYLGAGLEKGITEGAVGFAFAYTDLDTDNAELSRGASGQLYQGMLYSIGTLSGLRVDTQISVGLYDLSTNRSVTVGENDFAITADAAAFTFSAEAGLGKVFDLGDFDLTPRLAARSSLIEFSRVSEQGEGSALSSDLGTFRSVQGRAGASLAGRAVFRPFLNAEYVHEFEDRPSAFGVNFVGGVGPVAGVALPTTDSDWVEVSAGLGYQTGNIGLSLSAETTIARDDISYQSYRATATFRF